MPSLLSLLQCGSDELSIMDSSVAQHDLWRKEDVGRWTVVVVENQQNLHR